MRRSRRASWLLRQDRRRAFLLPNWRTFPVCATHLSCRCLARRGSFGTPTEPRRCATDCEWNPDFEQDYAIGITDILAILGIFGAVDNDQDGLWDVNDLCEDTTACNYDANPTEACLYEDAFGVCGGDGFFPELLIGSWQFTTATGAIAVGPDPYSDAWYSSEANGLQSAQYDDIYTFHPDGSLTTDYNGSIIDALQTTRRLHTTAPRLPPNSPRRRHLGRGCLARLVEMECACPFIGTNDAGLVYDIVSVDESALVLRPRRQCGLQRNGLFFRVRLHPIRRHKDTEMKSLLIPSRA